MHCFTGVLGVLLDNTFHYIDRLCGIKYNSSDNNHPHPGDLYLQERPPNPLRPVIPIDSHVFMTEIASPIYGLLLAIS